MAIVKYRDKYNTSVQPINSDVQEITNVIKIFIMIDSWLYIISELLAMFWK